MNTALLAQGIMDGTKPLESGNMLYVCLMGIGIVFVGLIAIIIICSIMSLLFKGLGKEKTPKPVEQEIPNRQEFIAAVSAAIAEDMGKDVSAIRILSVKKL